MELKRNLAGQLAFWIFNRHTESAVDRRPDAMADCKDFIPVPVSTLQDLDSAIIPVQFPPTVFVVQVAPHIANHLVVTDVRLITERLPVSIHRFRAKLNPGVAVTWNQLHIHRQIKILHLDVGPDELVPGNVFVRMPDDGTILHRPVTFVAFPASQVLSVEEHFLVLGMQRCSDRK